MVSISKINDLSKRNLSNVVITEYVGENNEGQRIDNYLIKYLKCMPKSHIYQLVRSGQVRVNSKRISAGYRLQINDKIRIPPVRIVKDNAAAAKVIAKSRFISINILFHDDGLLVIDKPSGMAVHGGSGVSFGVIEQLRAQHPDWKYLELVHRLDRETSGVLLLAKKRKVLIDLHQQIREGKVEKHYLVLVKGHWHNQKQNVKLFLDKYLTTTGERRVAVVTDKHSAKDRKGIYSYTIFTLRKSWKNFSLLDAKLETGRTHQIRVHLAHLGFPIAGDDKYGDFALNKQLAKNTIKLQRMFLHARKIDITHPLTGEHLSFEAPLTSDIQVFLNSLGASSQLTR